MNVSALRDRRVSALGWISLVSQILIVATGGAVRLTGSGLGCPTWPMCTADSLISTPEMGWHGVVEFGNRALSMAVGVIAIAVLLAVYRWAKERQELIVLAWIVLLGVIVQGLVGGITVLTGLNPFIVGFHYLASIALVCVCTAFVVLERRTEHPSVRSPRWFRLLALVMAATALVTIVLGVLTTGAGPHSGDADAGRSGYDAVALSHLHAIPSYVLVAITVILTVTALVRRLDGGRLLVGLLTVQAAQIAVGIFQSRAGLPAVAVGVHLVLAAVLAAVATAVVVAAWMSERPLSQQEPLDTFVVDDERVVSLTGALRDLERRFPTAPPRQIRSILLSEWEASSGGVPPVVPHTVLRGAVEQIEGLAARAE